ncbi:redoxin domain-containing protein [Aureibaculum sp. 2210JD6-5]|uniref:redoxin domain-containing protein n=1 Tax=Aureibaculum sp. 2210JD6-5 TaxID=3103957 RepID=UPI002AADCAC6|nr:thioredoxin-like domain-containing protein [Aureibaculum sp. 2210JD6-5]MDY7394115.1 redoxin domain-containing protein [Aureibaculum sp. 2210JD6-5]
MKNSWLYFLYFIALLLFSCLEEKSNFTIQADLKNISNGTLFYLKSWNTGRIIDSTYIYNGNLSLEGELNDPENLLLYATDSLSKEFIYTNLLIGNENVKFEADKKDFPWNIDVSGSVHQDKAERLNQIEYQRQETINELKLNYSSDKDMLSKKINQVSDSLDNVKVKLIKEDFNNYAALNAFKYHKTKFTNEELSSLYDKLDLELKKTIFGKAIKLQSEYTKPKVGDKYYDYRAINQNGDTLALSHIKDKYILLHFSSSACFGSQMSLHELKEIYKHYDNDLEIVSISEDISRKQWQNTVKKDSIPWTYLWDGKGEFGDAVVKYWALGTPIYFLISPDKIILENWYGYEDGIFEEKLKKYFN